MCLLPLIFPLEMRADPEEFALRLMLQRLRSVA
jgi:hypothetical protein